MKQQSRLPRLPRSIPEFLAYQLARHLDDDERVTAYMRLTTRFPVPFLIATYRNATAGTKTITDRRTLFWQIIERSRSDE
jgi:hypothetical protein